MRKREEMVEASETPVSKALASDDPRHGTWNAYCNHGCRCDACRQANTDKCREYNHRTGRNRPREQYLADVEAHGASRYRKARCRCDECREGARLEKARQRARNPEFVARENAARMRRHYQARKKEAA